MGQQTNAEWWGSRIPWVSGNPKPEDDSTPAPLGNYMAGGSAQLTPASVKVMGAQFAPDGSHNWRKPGDLPVEVIGLYRDTPADYSAEALTDLDRKGGNLINKLGMYPTLCSTQERTMRQMGPQLQYASENRYRFPTQYPWVRQTLTEGVVANYRDGTPRLPRIRGLPYQTGNEEHCQYIAKKLWKDVYAENLFV